MHHSRAHASGGKSLFSAFARFVEANFTRNISLIVFVFAGRCCGGGGNNKWWITAAAAAAAAVSVVSR
jgi:hypothetical protein